MSQIIRPYKPKLHLTAFVRDTCRPDCWGMGQRDRYLSRALTAINERFRQRNFVEVMMPIRNRVASNEGHFLLVGAIERTLIDLAVAAQSQPLSLISKQRFARLRPTRMGDEQRSQQIVVGLRVLDQDACSQVRNMRCCEARTR